jgi:hypothetical protein
MSVSTKKSSEQKTIKTKEKLPNEFDNLINTYLENIYKDDESKNLELEVRFGTRNIEKISKIDYINVIKVLVGQGFEILQDDLYLLRIQSEYLDEKTGKTKISNIRTEIEGLNNIESYCQKNNIISLMANGHVGFTQKSYFTNGEETYLPVNQDEFNFRLSLQLENKLSESSEIIQNIIRQWNDNKKIFRFIKRCKLVHKDYPLVVDLGIVKTSKKNRNYYIPEYDIKSAEVFSGQELYEIEIEIDNKKVSENMLFKSPITLSQSIRKVIKFIMCGLQQTNYPISYSEQNKIIQEYLKIVKDKSYREEQKGYPRDFIGPSSLTLQMQNIISLDVAQESDSVISNVRTNYTVTDKADGLRKLLFINENGFIYLINTNLKVEFTGYKISESDLYNTIIDGEHITSNKKGNPINLFAAFDCYFINNKNVTPFAFYKTSSDEKSSETRLSILISLIKKIKLQSKYVQEIPFRIEAKKFYADSPTQDIFKACNIIINNIDEGLLEYNTDGIIFTPKNMAVGQDKIGIPAPSYKTTWIHSFKWKPPEFNTIDFLVTINKNSAGLPIINNMFKSGIDLQKETQLTSYQTITLRVGFDEKKHGYINPCENVINNKLPVQEDIENVEPYKPVQFYPTNPTNYNAGIANILLQKDKLDQYKMFTEENEVIEDFTIVEFKYDHSKEEFWKWIPLRVRTDKTAELRSGGKNYGNAYHVANSNWHSIHNPITKEMITTGENIPYQLGDDDIYYNKVTDKSKNYTKALRDFHNLYVKNMLIKSVSIPGNTLIDYAVGKGGDLPKWIGSKLSFVLGIDLSRDNIENRLDGACARYLNYYKKFTQMPYALFVQGNSSVNIKSGEALITEKGKQIIKCVFGEGPKDEKILGTGVYKNYGVAKNGFDISSIQFAIHYVFENILTLNNFLKNIAECTKLNGYFIGTSYDGDTIFKELKSKQKNESISIYKDEKKIWEIKKQYNNDTFENNNSCLGYAIDVYQESINKTFREYLVNYDYLIRILENYGFILLTSEETKELNMPNSIGTFNQLFYQMQNDIKKDKKLKTAYGQSSFMTEEERKISFLNKYFIFKKVRQVDIEEVYKIEINKKPEDDVVDIEATLEAKKILEDEEIKLESSKSKSKLEKVKKTDIKEEIKLKPGSEVDKPKITTSVKETIKIKKSTPKK